jgi:hypothetical protein
MRFCVFYRGEAPFEASEKASTASATKSAVADFINYPFRAFGEEFFRAVPISTG